MDVAILEVMPALVVVQCVLESVERAVVEGGSVAGDAQRHGLPQYRARRRLRCRILPSKLTLFQKPHEENTHNMLCVKSYLELDILCDEVLRIYADGGALVRLEQLILLVEVARFVAPLNDGLLLAIPFEGDVWLGGIDENLLPT